MESGRAGERENGRDAYFLYLSRSPAPSLSRSPSSPLPIPDVSVVELTIEADVGVDFDRVIFRADAHVRKRVAEVSTFDYARAPAGVDLYFARQRNLAVEKRRQLDPVQPLVGLRDRPAVEPDVSP